MALYETMVVALDFSPAAEIVGGRAKMIAQTGVGSITLLHVVEYVPPISLAGDPFVPPVWDLDDEALRDKALQQLQQLAGKLGLADAVLEVKLGIPKTEIVEDARARGADLIVIGSHGRHGLSRLLGSTADAVLHSAHCDVLAVRVTQ